MEFLIRKVDPMRSYSFIISLGLCLLLAVSLQPQAGAHPGHEEAPAEAVLERQAQSPSGMMGEWSFWPDYTLPGRDAVTATSSDQADTTADAAVPISERLSPSRLWFGQHATHRERGLLDADRLPQNAFTVEFWVSYHVDQPIGAAVLAFDSDRNQPALWQFGFWEGDVHFTRRSDALSVPTMELKTKIVEQDLESGVYKRGVDRYWHHLVGVYDGQALKVYHQGELIAEQQASGRRLRMPDGAEFEIAAYLGNEPHMTLGNLVRDVAIYDRALSTTEIVERFQDHKELVDKGVHFRDRFHFTTAAPHIAFPETDNIQIVWEADRPHSALVEWGTTKALGNSMRLEPAEERMRKVRLEGLSTNTTYYYRVTLFDSNETELNSGLLSFRTAVEPGDPVVFAAISDTEARPHVNAHLANLIWRETPHFLINAGDLTDGGRHDQRVEWTHEYFAAMGRLMARMPVLPVMGNGENDFVWFDRYHADRGPGRSYYAYRYGDVEVFVLDSNLTARDDDPQFRQQQRDWLARSLQESDAKWKIATHHHPVMMDRYPEVVSDFVDLYEAYGVDMVLVGHHHNYLRSWPLKKDTPDLQAGITYVQLGGGGGNVSDRPLQADLRWAKTYQGYGYSIISILDDQLHYRMYDDSGAMRDSFQLVKRISGRPARLLGTR